MLISDSHQFIFVRVRKTASQSMWQALEPYVLQRPDGRWARFKSRAGLERDYRKYRFRAHEEITTAQKLLPPEKFDRYFKFAIVRNPWRRLVSEYEFILKSPSHGRHGKVKKLGSFERFVDMQIPRRDAYQVNQLCDADGRLLGIGSRTCQVIGSTSAMIQVGSAVRSRTTTSTPESAA